MKFKTLMLASTVTGFAILAGCSSPSVINKSDGSQVMTSDKPEYNDDTGFYEYNKDGNRVQINKDDVKSIEEVR